MMVHMTVKIYNNNDDDDYDDDGAPVLVLDGLQRSFLPLPIPIQKCIQQVILAKIGQKSNASRLYFFWKW